MGALNSLYESLSGAARNNLWRESIDAERVASRKSAQEWAKDAGNNTPNLAQAFAPDNQISPSAYILPAAAVAALRAKDQPLEDAYSPIDMLLAGVTGGGGLLSRLGQAAVDPAISAGMDYLPAVADAINPRNIMSRILQWR